MDTWGEYGLSWTGPDVDDADVPPLLQQYGYNAMTEVGSCEDAKFGEAECCSSNQKNDGGGVRAAVQLVLPEALHASHGPTTIARC